MTNERNCSGCRHYDPDGTLVPVCVLHRKYMHWQWICGDYSPSERKGDSDAGKKDA